MDLSKMCFKEKSKKIKKIKAKLKLIMEIKLKDPKAVCSGILH